MTSCTIINIPPPLASNKNNQKTDFLDRLPQTAHGRPTIPANYSHIPSKFNNNINSSVLSNSCCCCFTNDAHSYLAILLFCMCFCLFVLGCAIWTHPAWDSFTFNNQLDRNSTTTSQSRNAIKNYHRRLS